MSVRAISMALHLSGISTRAKLVMIGLCDCANDDTFGCFPSRKHLARIGDCSVDTVDRALRELSDALLVEVQPQYRDEGSRVPAANLYRVFPTFDPSRKSAAIPQEHSRIPAQGSAAIVRLPRPQADAARVAAQDAATKEPEIEPEEVVSSSPSVPVSKQVIEALIERCGDGCDPTAASLHHGADLNRMLRAGCDWVEDIEPAADRVAASFKAKGKRFRSWELLVEHAVDFRDRRLAGLPAPQPVHERQPRATSNRRPSMATVVNRMLAEGKLT